MCDKFVPSYHMRGVLLRSKDFNKVMCWNDYFKELESLMLRVDLDESHEEKVTRFVSGLRRDI